MKIFMTTLLASYAATAFGQNPVDPTSGDDLKNTWNMDEPKVDYNTATNSFSLTFNTTTHYTNFVSDQHINEEFYDINCKTGDGTEHVISSGIVADDSSPGVYGRPYTQQNGNEINMGFRIEPGILTQDSKLYTPFTNGTGVLKFCVRTSLGFNGVDDVSLNLQQQIDGGFKEVNFIESLITVEYDLQNNFSVLNVNVEPKDKLTTTFAEDEYGILAWLCNISSPLTDFDVYQYTPTGQAQVTRSYPPEIDDPAFFFNQGGLISVCVRPVDQAYSEGIVMDEISDFSWSRSSGPVPITQAAIETGNSADNLLTYYPTCSNADYCRFSSILFADFYITRGTASGTGSAKTKFATSRRRLGAAADGNNRLLQEGGLGSSFNIAIEVDAGDDGPGALKTAAGVSRGFTALASVMAIVGMMFFA